MTDRKKIARTLYQLPNKDFEAAAVFITEMSTADKEEQQSFFTFIGWTPGSGVKMSQTILDRALAYRMMKERR